MSHVDPFNALGGFSVGIPPELVIDENGNVVNNVNAPNANVTANRVYANYYYWANGQPFVPNATAAGSNSQVQFNNNGNFGATSAFTFNSTTNLLTVSKLATTSANLGNVGNIIIAGGNNGYFLQTDGTGNLTWAAATGNGGNGSPAGANTQVQFNDSGVFGGDAGFTYNKTNNTLTTGNIVADYINANWDVTANVVYANYLYGDASNVTNVAYAITAGTVVDSAQPNITSVGTLTSLNLSGNITNANWINASYFAGNGSPLFGIVGANVTGTVANATNANFAAYAGNVTVANQPNITTVGTLTDLAVSGNANLGNVANANYFIGNFYGLANLARSVTLASQPNITSLGTLTTLAVSGNTNLGVTNTSNLFANNFTVSNSFTTLGNVIAGNVYANAGNIRANLFTGTLTTALQPNITLLGTLSSLSVSGNASMGNISAGNLVSANFLSGTLTTNNQPNINYLGTLGYLNVNTTVPNSNGNITFNGSLTGNGSYSNINITGNLNAGNYVQAELLIGNITTASQPNITTVGTLTGLTVSGVTDLGLVGNVKILGGTNGYVLQTDGTGNLSWVAQANGGGGNGVPGGSNTQIQFNNSGSFGGSPNLSWTNLTNFLYVGGNINVTGYVNASVLTSNVATGTAPFTVVSTTPVANLSVATADTVRNAAQPNITSVGTLSNLSVTGNLVTNNLTVNTTFTTNGNIVTPLNVFANSGTVKATLLIGTLSTISSSQPNITSVGTLTSLNVTGNITAGNASLGNLVDANFISGTLTADSSSQPNIHYLGDVGWLNVNTSMPNSNGNIRFNGTLTGYGTASDINITGNVNAGNYVQAELLIGNLTTSSQPNITTVGTLTGLTVAGNSNFGNVGNITITGGSNGYVLSTDGAGNLNWVAQTGNGGNTQPGGNNTQIQYNANGAFAGSGNLTWNDSAKRFFVGGNANVNGTVTALTFTSNIATGSSPFVVSSTTPVANLGVETAATVRNNAQPNINSVGTLTTLTVSGNGIFTSNLSVSNTFTAGNITTPGTIGTSNLNVTGLANFTSNAYIHTAAQLFVRGNINAANSANINLGNIANLHISGGINGYVLQTDGAGNLSWAAGGSGGNGTPGGSNTQLQFNDAGVFGGSPTLTFNKNTSNFTVAGNLVANTVTIGSGIYQFCHSNVFFATTNSTAEQDILAIPAEDVAAVDYTIISTDSTIRNFIKISTVINGSTLNYVEYSTLPVNGYTGDFTVTYDPGSIIDPPAIILKMTPQTSNVMTHKMMVTVYKE